MKAMVDQIMTLSNRLDEAENKQHQTDQMLSTMKLDIEELENQQVLEEHFYSNDRLNLPRGWHCLPRFYVPPGTTLEFRAVFSSNTMHKANSWASSVNLRTIGGESVVLNVNSGQSTTWFTHNAQLTYSGKNETEDDVPYQMCFNGHDAMGPEGAVVDTNRWQWGYKILGSAYNLIEHRFDESAFEQA